MKYFLRWLRKYLDNPAQGNRTACLLALMVPLPGMLLTGCATMPANKALWAEDSQGMLKQVKERKNRIVHVSPERRAGEKSVLLLLHGATDDPTEMTDIVKECRKHYDVFLYSFNYHEHVEKIGADLVKEVKRLEGQNNFVAHATVVVFSYSAVVFREAVISAEDPSVFAGMSLVQLVPTAGGSLLARWMRYPIFGMLASLASKPSAAENPYGQFAEKLWGGEGNKKFSEVIDPERTYSILLEGDPHSLATVKNLKVHQRYKNGIGTNVVVIPKSAGVTHEYLPTHPKALAFLNATLELLRNKESLVQAPAPRALAQRDHLTEYPQARRLGAVNPD